MFTCSKLTIETLEQGVFIVDFEHISQLVLVFLFSSINFEHAIPGTNVKPSDCGLSDHPQLFFKKDMIEANELETYENSYPFDLIFSLCSDTKKYNIQYYYSINYFISI